MLACALAAIVGAIANDFGRVKAQFATIPRRSPTRALSCARATRAPPLRRATRRRTASAAPRETRRVAVDSLACDAPASARVASASRIATSAGAALAARTKTPRARRPRRACASPRPRASSPRNGGRRARFRSRARCSRRPAAFDVRRVAQIAIAFTSFRFTY